MPIIPAIQLLDFNICMSVLLWPNYDVCAENGSTVIRVFKSAALSRVLAALALHHYPLQPQQLRQL